MPGPNRFAAYVVMILAVLLGGGSLLLFAVFLGIGAFGPVLFRASQTQILLWDGFLCLVFFVQHSGMVRKSSKKRFARIIHSRYHPAAYSIASGIALTVMVVLWQPSHVVLYKGGTQVLIAMHVLGVLALLGFFSGIRALGNFDTFGLEPVRAYVRGTTAEPSDFRLKGPYLWVRHPLYLFVLVLIWLSSTLTLDRLLLNVLFTVWMIVGTYLEERDLVADFGDSYRRYQKTVPMLLPLRGPAGRHLQG